MPLDLAIPYNKDTSTTSYLPIGPHQVIPGKRVWSVLMFIDILILKILLFQEIFLSF